MTSAAARVHTPHPLEARDPVPMTTAVARPLMVFADDWGRHPSSCQHLVGKLLPHREVIWVNTIGTRPPRLDWSTAARVAGKLRAWTSSTRAPETGSTSVPSPRILAPKMWPSFKSRMARRANRELLLRSLSPIVETLGKPPIIVTTLPLVADLVDGLAAHRWIYYCVDDFSVWPGYDGETMLRMERDLVPRMNDIVAVSETLVSHIETFGRRAHLLTHGVDLDHWRRPATADLPLLAGLEPPFVVFWGVLDRRMDVSAVRRLGEQMRAGTIVLVGPREDPDPALFQIPRVTALPQVPFAALPGLARAASVLVMPYADLPATRAMQPLKLKEYLATGKPVVVSSLPATRAWNDCCDVCDDPDDFAAAVIGRLGSGVSEQQRLNRVRLEDESWADKAQQFEGWIDDEGGPANQCVDYLA
jgi:glycosyltransferase involved in cell wall biosynthesis